MVYDRMDLVKLFKPQLDEFLKYYKDLKIISLPPRPEISNQSRHVYDISSSKALDLAKSMRSENRSIIADQFQLDDLDPNMIDELSNIINQNLQISGCFLYPENGGMSWHTNNDYPGIRIYFSFAYKSNCSFFRYQNPETGEIITDFDKEGWQCRVFSVGGKQSFWHCVQTLDSKRLSIGFGPKQYNATNNRILPIRTSE